MIRVVLLYIFLLPSCLFAEEICNELLKQDFREGSNIDILNSYLATTEKPTVQSNFSLEDIEISNQSSLSELAIKLDLSWKRDEWIYKFNRYVRLKDWFKDYPTPKIKDKNKHNQWLINKNQVIADLDPFECTFFRSSEITTLLKKFWYPEVYANDIGSNLYLKQYNQLSITNKPDKNYHFFLSSNLELEVKNEDNFHKFPFDSINVSAGLNFRNINLNIDSIKRVQNKEVIGRVLKQWDVINVDLKIDHMSAPENQKLIYSVQLDRNSFYYIAKIILPIILIVCLSFGNFWIRSKEIEAKLNLTVGSLLSLIAYNFVFGEDIPKLNYLTILDSLILISYFFAFLSTVAAIATSYLFTKGQSSGEFHNWDRPLRLLLPLAYLIIILFYLYPVYRSYFV